MRGKKRHGVRFDRRSCIKRECVVKTLHHKRKEGGKKWTKKAGGRKKIKLEAKDNSAVCEGGVWSNEGTEQKMPSINLHDDNYTLTSSNKTYFPSFILSNSFLQSSPSALKAHVLNFDLSLLNFKPVGPPCLGPHVPRILNTVIKCRLDNMGSGGCCWTSTSILSSSRNGFMLVGEEEGEEEELTLHLFVNSVPF